MNNYTRPHLMTSQYKTLFIYEHHQRWLAHWIRGRHHQTPGHFILVNPCESRLLRSYLPRPSSQENKSKTWAWEGLFHKKGCVRAQLHSPNALSKLRFLYFIQTLNQIISYNFSTALHTNLAKYQDWAFPSWQTILQTNSLCDNHRLFKHRLEI